jgi:nucleotide-binding universal stress UspA family protein
MELSQKILVATDFSRASELALEAAPMLALQNDAQVTLVHVLAVDPLDDGAIEQSTVEKQELEAAVHAHLDALREQYLSDVRDVKTVIVRSRSTAEAICELAEKQDADLILIATHGRTGLAHFLIGSVTERVVRHAPCPVLVMRSKSKA